MPKSQIAVTTPFVSDCCPVKTAFGSCKESFCNKSCLAMMFLVLVSYNVPWVLFVWNAAADSITSQIASDAFCIISLVCICRDNCMYQAIICKF